MDSLQQLKVATNIDKPVFTTPLRRYSGAIMQHPNRLMSRTPE